MLSLLINVVIPAVIMLRLSGEDRLGPVNALLIALAFPFFYGAYSLYKERKVDWLPVIGLVSILISGGVGLLKLPASYIAIKEAAVPGLIAVAILVSAWLRKPLARLFLEQVLDTERVHGALRERGTFEEYERRTSIATWLLAGAFLLSAVLNFVLAKIVVTADGGTQQFTEQLGEMTALSFPVIVVPTMAVLMGTLFYVMSTIKKLTGLEGDEVLRQPNRKRPVTAAPREPQ